MRIFAVGLLWLSACQGGAEFELSALREGVPAEFQARTGFDGGLVRGEYLHYAADADPAYGIAWQEPEYLGVDIRGRGENGVLMTGVTMFNVDWSTVAVGDRWHTQRDLHEAEWELDWESGPAVAMVSCGGPTDDELIEDEVHEEAEVEVVAVDGPLVTLSFAGQMSANRGQVEGVVRVDLSEGQTAHGR